jgi:hypothetical protein
VLSALGSLGQGVGSEFLKLVLEREKRLATLFFLPRRNFSGKVGQTIKLWSVRNTPKHRTWPLAYCSSGQKLPSGSAFRAAFLLAESPVSRFAPPSGTSLAPYLHPALTDD